MVFFLCISLLLLILLNILIIGLFLSKLSINIENYNAYSNSGFGNIVIDKMQISIDLYLYKFIKIVLIKFYRNYFKICFLKVYYWKIAKYKKVIFRKSIFLGKLLAKKNKLSLNVLNPTIDKFNMNLSLCSKNAAITSIASSLIGSVIAIILSNSIKKYNNKKIFYKIIPVYFNVNGFKIDLKTKIDFNTLNIFVFLYDYYLAKNKN